MSKLPLWNVNFQIIQSGSIQIRGRTADDIHKIAERTIKLHIKQNPLPDGVISEIQVFEPNDLVQLTMKVEDVMGDLFRQISAYIEDPEFFDDDPPTETEIKAHANKLAEALTARNEYLKDIDNAEKDS